jgi:hypothetical protein
MNPIAVAFSVAVPAAFAAGVVFHKYVISEAEKIKQAVLASEQRIRTDVASFLTKTGGDVTKVASKV